MQFHRLQINFCFYIVITIVRLTIQNCAQTFGIIKQRFKLLLIVIVTTILKAIFKPKRVVFLDRDGTINKRPARACYIEKPEEFVWLSGAMEAIHLLKENGFLVIIITNQPGIARGNLTEEMLYRIHEKLRADLLKEKVDVDDIFYCPHNWDDGCFCRKPNPGMLFEAQKKYSLNLYDCYLIGDDERDILAGKSAGCICRLVNNTYTVLDAAKEIITLEKRGGNT